LPTNYLVWCLMIMPVYSAVTMRLPAVTASLVDMQTQTHTIRHLLLGQVLLTSQDNEVLGNAHGKS
jgi:hypothetical protein